MLINYVVSDSQRSRYLKSTDFSLSTFYHNFIKLFMKTFNM